MGVVTGRLSLWLEESAGELQKGGSIMSKLERSLKHVHDDAAAHCSRPVAHLALVKISDSEPPRIPTKRESSWCLRPTAGRTAQKSGCPYRCCVRSRGRAARNRS
jgi:hypothetical protein